MKIKREDKRKESEGNGKEGVGEDLPFSVS